MHEPQPRPQRVHALRWVHFVVGAAGLAAFLETGQYMDRTLDHLAGMPDAPRALYRSAHIYILFASLIHLVLGAYVVSAGARVPRYVQYAGSALLLAALGCFLYGFYVETPAGIVERPLIRTGIELSLGGVLLHAGAGLSGARPPATPQGRQSTEVQIARDAQRPGGG